jgi:hypothetical protein
MAAASPCAAAVVAAAPAHAVIVDPATVQVNWALAQPSIQGITQGATFVGTMPALGLGLTLPGHAQLIIRREDDTGAPVTAPGVFEVTTGGPEALVIRTGGGASLRPISVRTVAGGELLGGKAASIDVARGVLRAPDAPGLPAPQTLVVVVQYN